TKLWNKNLGNEFPMSDVLFEQNSFQYNNVCYKSALRAVDVRVRIRGYIIVIRWQAACDVVMSTTIGGIEVILVDQDVRGRGHGSKLIAHSDSELIALGAEQILLGRDPYHYFPGIPSEYKEKARWFEAKGYINNGREFDLLREYTGDEGKTLPEMDNVEFTLLDQKEKEAFLAFLYRCFPGRWEYEALEYFRKGGTGREFVVLRKNNRIIGFCRINDEHSPMIAQNVYWAPLITGELGGVGPLGIDENERGQGYGLAIVEAGLAFLR